MAAAGVGAVSERASGFFSPQTLPRRGAGGRPSLPATRPRRAATLGDFRAGCRGPSRATLLAYPASPEERRSRCRFRRRSWSGTAAWPRRPTAPGPASTTSGLEAPSQPWRNAGGLPEVCVCAEGWQRGAGGGLGGRDGRDPASLYRTTGRDRRHGPSLLATPHLNECGVWSSSATRPLGNVGRLVAW